VIVFLIPLMHFVLKPSKKSPAGRLELLLLSPLTHPPSLHSDACWGSQIGSAVANGSLLPLFDVCSMNKGIIFPNGGPVAVGWLGN
jgi:hypothetical protein